MEWNPFDSSFFSEEFGKIINALFEEEGITANDIVYFALSQLSNSDNQVTLHNVGAEAGDKYGYTGCNSPILALSEVG